MQRIVPYLQLMRLHKPIGIWLLFFPAAWAVLLAPAPFDPILLGMMLVGAVFIRTAGCIINDLTDQELDRHVERTKSRPLASGAVSRRSAWALLMLLLLGGLGLCLMLPARTLLLAAAALPLIAAYPWMKRLTWWPQAFLGLTFNFGALIGWVATGTPIGPVPLLLYAGCFFWTLGYDTLYAVEDMEGDATVGIKSTARRIGTGARLACFTGLCYGLFLACFALATDLAGLWSGGVWLGVGAAALHAGWQVRRAGGLVPGSTQAGLLFRSNQWLGLMLLAGLLAQRLLPYLS